MTFKRTATVWVMTVIAAAAFASGEGESQSPSITIHEASLLGDVDAIKGHVAAGADINSVDEYGSTPLTIAATFGQSRVARVLIELGADVGIPNDEGSTPLHTAAFLCRKDIVRMLLEAGASTRARNATGLRPIDMVLAPFDQVKPIYDGIRESLSPLGLELDYAYIETTRPEIAALLAE